MEKKTDLQYMPLISQQLGNKIYIKREDQHLTNSYKIRGALIKRVFNELQKKADKSPSEYSQFWENFGAVLKEGLYEDHENREKILNLVKFKSTNSEDTTSLKDYIERMKKGQDNIFYISDSNLLYI